MAKKEGRPLYRAVLDQYDKDVQAQNNEKMEPVTTTPTVEKVVIDESEIDSVCQNLKHCSLNEQIDQEMNRKLFNGLVLQSVINKLPASMPSFDRISIIKRLKEELGDIDVNLSEIPWHLIMVNQSKIDSYIQELSSKHNFSYEHFLCPPVKYCIVEKCTSLKDSELTKNHMATQVVLCTSLGLQTASLFQYRCRYCNTCYGYDTYGTVQHKLFYDNQRTNIKATQILYIQRSVMDFWRQLSLHSQVSFESLAICYNSSFKQQSVLVKNIFESYNDEDELEEEEENKGYFLKTQLNRRQIASGFWTYLVEEESREMDSKPVFTGNVKNSYDQFMDQVDNLRKSSLYPHDCNQFCDTRACPKSTSMDGIWKIRYNIKLI